MDSFTGGRFSNLCTTDLTTVGSIVVVVGAFSDLTGVVSLVLEGVILNVDGRGSCFPSRINCNRSAGVIILSRFP